MSMDCDSIRAAILAGELDADPEVERHVEECEACRELLAGGPLLGLLRGSGPDLTPPPVGGAVDRIRSLSTPVRVSLLVSGVLFVGAVNALFLLRPDAEVFPLARMLVSLAALAIPAVLAGLLVLRPLFRPRPGRHLLPALVSAGILVPVMIAILPAAHAMAETHPESFEGTGADFWPRAIGCFIYGSIMGLPILAGLHLLGRGGRGPWITVLASLIAAALAGNVALQLHCPLLDHTHQLVGHAGVPIVAFLVGLPLALRRPRGFSRSM